MDLAEAEELDAVIGFYRGEQIEKCGLVAAFVANRSTAGSTLLDTVDRCTQVSRVNLNNRQSYRSGAQIPTGT